MQTNILILALVVASVTGFTGTHCTCEELTVQGDCSNGCAWVTVNGSGSCKGATVTSSSTDSCGSKSSRSSCDAINSCAWTNAGVCAPFTACADYSVDTGSAPNCQEKDSTCIPGAVSNGQVTCKSGTLSCPDVTDQTVCQSKLYESTQKICWWISSKCATQDISRCTTITDSSLCDKAECVYANNACAAPTCAEQKNQGLCSVLRADDPSKYQICNWTGSACVDYDATTLTQSNCYSASSGTYSWNGSACRACSGSSSNSVLLAFIGFLALLIF